MSTTTLYATITQQILTAITAGQATGPWTMPWHTTGRTPYNIASQKPYRGINTLLLWATAQQHGYAAPVWGTFAQWRAHGHPVKKGARATQMVFWSVTAPEDTDDGAATTQRVWTRHSHVFNAAQVQGTPPAAPPPLAETARLAQAVQFFAQLQPTIVHGAPLACYIPSRDEIHLPHFAQFTSAAAFYATLGHEATHWSGHPSRLQRDLSGRFGSAAYAMEELVAELGAAFLCGTLGLAVEPRADHAQYINSWLAVLHADPRALFTAASKAQAAVDWMQAQHPAA